MTQHDERFDRAVHILKERVHLRPDLDRRIMSQVRGVPRPARPGAVGRAVAWAIEPRLVRIRPAVVAVAAAAVLAIVNLRGPAAPPAAEGPGLQPDATPVRFVLVAPSAASVAVVGDFNDWLAEATPLRTVHDGLWTVTVPLGPGRYRYAFLVDGTTWVPDPGAPRALDDDFGRPNSVLTLGGS